MPPTLSVAIITFNEEANLARTLASEQFADEIVVVDSGSTDRTLEIAQSFDAKIISSPWKGFAGQKNTAIESCTGTWILSLDADEELTPELKSEFRALLRCYPTADAYLLRRRNLLPREPLDPLKSAAYYPDPKLRPLPPLPLGKLCPIGSSFTDLIAPTSYHRTIATAFEGTLRGRSAPPTHSSHHTPTPPSRATSNTWTATAHWAPRSSSRKGKSAAPSSPSTITSSLSQPSPSSITTSSASASLMAARAFCYTSTTPPTPSWKYAKAWQTTRKP